jgi:hypothetical protein
LKELLISLDLEGVLIQEDALHTRQSFFRWCLSQGADVLLTDKSKPKTLNQQIGCQFQEKRHIPLAATDHEKRHGRDTPWELGATEAPEHIKDNWPGSAWVVEVIANMLTRKVKRNVRRHLFLNSVRTTPEALLQLVTQRVRF